MDVNGKKVLVLGAGRSGVASAKFLLAHGATVARLTKRRAHTLWSHGDRALAVAVVSPVG